MSIPQQQQASPPPTSSTAAAAVTDLTAIDADITTLLSTASSAIRCLSSTPEKERQGEFVSHATTYHVLLSSITARLRRQILQLQAAEIPVAVGTGGGGGGSGGIDVGVLNSKNDVVGREMEAECWGAARTFLERRGGWEGAGEMPVRSQGLEEMEVDR
jgi:hypothetical protein